MVVKLATEIHSTRHGIIFPAGKELKAERDDISMKVYHPDQSQVWIRVADRNLLPDTQSTEPKPGTKAARIVALAKQVSLFEVN